MSAQHGGGQEERTVLLDPVVVTGTGTHHRLKDTPSPVDVVTASEIRKAGITDFQQAMTMLAPSLSFSTNAMGSYLMMNGLSNKYVLILINGKKLTGDTANNIDLSRIDMNRVRRIEILKGAGSSLYGSDAIAGVVNIITDTPDDPVTILSNTKVEAYGQFSEGANVDVKAGKVGSHTAYTRQQSDGWQLNPLDEAGEKTDRKASDAFHSNVLNQRFTWTPAQSLSLYAEGGYYDRMTKRPVSEYKYNMGYEASNFGLGTRYSLSRQSYIQLDLQNDNYDSNYRYIAEEGEFKPGDVSLTKRQHYYNANLKSLFRFTENTRTIFGLEYISESLFRPSAYVDEESYTMSAYGQEEITLFDHFQAVLGVRYMRHQNAGDNLAPKVSLMYQMNHWNVRGQYSAGFRAPGLDELYYFTFSSRGGTLTIGDRNLSAEKSHYGSLNLEYFNDWLTCSVTGYVNSLRDMINGRTTDMTGLTEAEQQAVVAEATEIIGASEAAKIKKVKRYVNDEKAIVKGIEINLNTHPVAGFSAGGSYIFADARSKDIEMGWRRIERSVRHSGSVNVNYAHTWNHYRLNVNLNGRMQSERFHLTTAFVNESAPGFGIWNLNTRHTFDGLRHVILEPGIGVNNLFDRTDNRPYGVNYAHLSPGRTVYASLLIRFKTTK
jgi:outer membrane receptor for ferrienterochelin and colicins